MEFMKFDPAKETHLFFIRNLSANVFSELIKGD